MTRIKLTQRMICNIARVDFHKVRQKRYTPDEVTELGKAATTLSNYKILIMDYSQLTPETFRASVMTVKRRFGVDCVIIDYLQLMQVMGQQVSWNYSLMRSTFRLEIYRELKNNVRTTKDRRNLAGSDAEHKKPDGKKATTEDSFCNWRFYVQQKEKQANSDKPKIKKKTKRGKNSVLK